MRLRSLATLLLILLLPVPSASADVFEAELNGLKITLDADTGGILKLEFPGPGKLLESAPQRAGMIDLAYPIDRFEPLRLAARFSRKAKITREKDAVTIEWERLGASRDFDLPGNVSVAVTFRAAPDGRSVILTARVANHSKTSVRQVIFPELSGMQPFAGTADTLFRTAGTVSPPFLELAKTEERASQQYMIDGASYSNEYKAGGMFHSMIARWMDFGGLRGGVSLFPRRWGWDPQIVTRLQLAEVDQSIRLLCLHDVEIKPEGTWESGEFWLTPHTGGWAKGIEPFRAWVKQNFKREWPLPKHVREGLGYRTTWMCQNQPDDPRDAVFTFKDLPKLAAECKEHGIDEMTLWAWNRGFVLPLPPPYPHLGSEQEMIDAVAECKKIGVNITPFISVLQANAETAPRYGLKVNDNNGWTFHTDLVPRWNPPYATGFACVPVPIDNPLWQKDVLAGAQHLIDSGIVSLGWDQFWTREATPNINTLTTQIRALARAKDPESVFMGEELWNFDIDSAQLDYTWNWGSYRDIRPLTSVYPAPRVNVCISESPLAAKKAFADNLYINVFPRKAESINGSDLIANHPPLSAALKQCASLRKQFLKYFTEGTLIGECILTEPSENAHVSAYVLPDHILMIVINQGPTGPINLKADPQPWVATPGGNFTVTAFGGDGKVISITTIAGQWEVATPALATGDVVIYEITTR
ncbi:MAG: hypothetical protein ABIP55_16000 [Tepidisphaeraceae bacterium]